MNKNKKIWLVLLIILAAIKTSAQFVPFQSAQYKHLAADTLYNLTGNGVPTATPNSYKRIVWYYDSTSHTNYYWQPENQVWMASAGSAIDTAGHWLTNLYRREDSVFYVKGGTETFAFIDSTGGGGSGINIYNTDSSLAGDRTVDLNGHELLFNDATYPNGLLYLDPAANTAAIGNVDGAAYINLNDGTGITTYGSVSNINQFNGNVNIGGGPTTHLFTVYSLGNSTKYLDVDLSGDNGVTIQNNNGRHLIINDDFGGYDLNAGSGGIANYTADTHTFTSNLFRATANDSIVLETPTLYAKIDSYLTSNAGAALVLADPTTGETQWQTLSSGSTNSNIGSGYRWAIPNTNNIKTAFGGFAIVIDSSSNTNGLTFKVDTTTGLHTENYFNTKYLTAEADPLSVHITDSAAMLSPYLRGVTLNTPNVLYTTPINYAVSGHVATGTMTLNTQSPYKLFGTGSSTATPTFIGPIDSNWVSGLHTEDYYNTKYLTTGSALTFSNGVTRTVNNVTNDLITGLAGGQTAIGGTAAGESLTLTSTSNATKGFIYLGTAHTTAYDGVNNRFGIGTGTPSTFLDVLGTTQQLRLAYDGSNTAGFTVNSTGSMTVDLLGTSPVTTFSQAVVLSGGFQTNSTVASSNMNVPGSTNAASTTTSANLIFGNNTTVNYRRSMRGSVNTTLPVGNGYGGTIFGLESVTEAASGTHPLLATAVFIAPVFTNGAAATTDATTVYISGAPTGITPTNQATAMWVASGTVKLAVGTTSSAPLNIPAGTLNTGGGIVSGNIEFDGTHGYLTIGGVQKQLDNQVASFGWPLTGTGTGTGATTITYGTPNWLTFNGPYTTTANNQWWRNESPTITARATASDVFIATQLAPTFSYQAASQEGIALDIAPTFTLNAQTTPSSTAIRHKGDIYPSATGTYTLGKSSNVYSIAWATDWNGNRWKSIDGTFTMTGASGVKMFTASQTNSNYLFSSNSVFVDSIVKVKIQGELQLTGGANILRIATPSTPTISNLGTAGSTTYSYKVAYRQVNGNTTDASAVATTTTGNATLSASNKNRITFASFPEGVYYADIYRTVGGATQGKIGTSTGYLALVYDDIGNAGDGSTAPTQNQTGSLVIGSARCTPSAILDLNTTTQGLLLPRMTKAQRDAIVGAVAGMAIYQTDNTPGLRCFNGTNWVKYSESND